MTQIREGPDGNLATSGSSRLGSINLPAVYSRITKYATYNSVIALRAEMNSLRTEPH